ETAANLAGIANCALDVGDFFHPAAENDCHAVTDIGAGIFPELVASFVCKREVDRPLSRVGVSAGIGRPEVSSGNDCNPLQYIYAIRVGAGGHGAGAVNQLLVRRKRSADTGERRLFVWIWP